MAFYLHGDRVTACRDGENEEKVTIESFVDSDVYKVKFPDGEILTRHAHQLLVDQDHQTCFNIDECGKDHVVSFQFHPSPAIDPVAKDLSGITKVTKLRMDVLTLIVDAVSMYPNTGAAITALIENIPKKD